MIQSVMNLDTTSATTAASVWCLIKQVYALHLGLPAASVVPAASFAEPHTAERNTSSRPALLLQVHCIDVQSKHMRWQTPAAKPGTNVVVRLMTGAKRMRPPLQQQSGSNSSAYHPSSEIALQQQMLKQQHSGGNSSMGSGPLFGGLGQAGADATQLQMHSQATGLHSSASPSASLDAVCFPLPCCLWQHFATCHAASLNMG